MEARSHAAAFVKDRALVVQAVRDVLPMFVPAIPFALILGVVIVESGVGPLLGWMSAPIMFGGAAQITLLSLLGEGASVAAAVSAALIVSARTLLYSATMAPHFQQQPRWFRWFGPYLLIDQVFALVLLRASNDPRDFRVYYLTVGLLFWSLWLIFCGIGLIIGPQVPPSWKLAFAAPVLFTALLVLAADRWQKVLAALIGASVTLALASLPNRSGLLIGALCGIAAGMAADAWRSARR
jgi:4-azaleucine resistance transporter AzlC